jgi:hypothetical protein
MLRTKLIAIVGAIALFGAGIMVGANNFGKPKSVVHVITVKWNDGVTDQQKKSVADGIAKMASETPGITNVWLKTLKVQGAGYGNVFAIEFKDDAAFKAYGNSAAHKEWEKVYLQLRAESTTHDVTNE